MSEMREFSICVMQELTRTASDWALDVAEVGFDCIFSEGVVKDIPVLSTMYGLVKTGLNIRDRIFARNLVMFLSHFKSGDICQDALQAFRARMKDKSYENRVLNTVIGSVNNVTEDAQNVVLARLFLSYLNERINWSQFVSFAHCVTHMVEDDYDALDLLYRKAGDLCSLYTPEEIHFRGPATKLVQFSLVNMEIHALSTFGDIPVMVMYKISSSGRLFYENGGRMYQREFAENSRINS